MKTWVEISKARLTQNFKEFDRHLREGVRFMAVVKANAYGHGLSGVAGIIARERTKRGLWFGVDSVDEGVELRKSGIKQPILVLGYAPLKELSDAAKYDLRITVYNKETILKLSEAAKKNKKKLKVHLKLDTGTKRQGVGEDEILKFAKFIKSFPALELEGLSTHYANIEDAVDHAFASAQLESFIRAEETLAKNNISVPLKHTACSAAAILFPETHFNMVRVGISLYGLWPSAEIRVAASAQKKKIKLNSVLTWKTVVAQLKNVASGTPIGYGLTEKLKRNSIIAVLPVGYYDGYDRGLSSVGEALIQGKRCKILGRVCMNMLMADVTSCEKVKLEDEAVLLGAQGEETITAEDIAKKINTINYEITTRINPFIPRMFV